MRKWKVKAAKTKWSKKAVRTNNKREFTTTRPMTTKRRPTTGTARATTKRPTLKMQQKWTRWTTEAKPRKQVKQQTPLLTKT